MIESIRYRWEFDLLKQRGRYLRSGPLSVRSEHGSDPGVHVAFAIGRSVGGAVVRNRVKRRLREILRDLDHQSRLSPGRYLIIASPDASTATFDDLRHHLQRLTAA